MKKGPLIITITIGCVISVVGLLALYLFTLKTHQSGTEILAHQVVLGFGILSFGLFYVLLGLGKLKAPFYIMVSLLSLIFASFSTAFDVQALLNNDGSLSVHSVVYSIVLFLISAVFAYLSVKKWKRI